jgi:hypothetical protein
MHPFHLQLTWESLSCFIHTLKINWISTVQESCRFIQLLSCFVLCWIGSKPYIKLNSYMRNKLYILAGIFFTHSPNNPTSQFLLLRCFCTNPYKNFLIKGHVWVQDRNVDVLGVTIFFRKHKRLSPWTYDKMAGPTLCVKFSRCRCNSQPNLTVRFSFEMKVRCHFAPNQFFVWYG